MVTAEYPVARALAGPAWHRNAAWATLVFALLVHCAFLAHFASRNAPTIDEGFHIAAGYRYWQCADFGINPEHPPLVKFVAAFPLRNLTFPELSAPCGAAVTAKNDGFTVGNALMNCCSHAARARR